MPSADLELRSHAEKLGFSSGLVPLQPGCAAFPVSNSQLHSSTSTPRAFFSASLPCHPLPTTAWGFHFLHDSLLNPLQIPNKHPDQLCGIILDAFPSFRICQLLAACITEADELRASITSWDMRMYLLGYHMLEGKTCLIQSVSFSTNPGCFVSFPQTIAANITLSTF